MCSQLIFLPFSLRAIILYQNLFTGAFVCAPAPHPHPHH